jgi:hypothetical protein
VLQPSLTAVPLYVYAALCLQARAAKVLQGVKERGKTRGDIMDAQTEAELRPQILQEAFAREVVAMVSAITHYQRYRNYY